MVGPEGRFVYRYMLPDPSITDAAYSATRHIAAVWGLIDLEREGWPIPDLGDAIDRAASYMNENLLTPYAGGKMLCVVDEGVIKIGGTALAAVALLTLDARAGRTDNRERAVRLTRYVAAQRLGDGDFVQVRVPGPISRPHPAHVDYVAGQAVLALVTAGDATGEAGWRELARDSAAKFARRNFAVGQPVHWILYALEALWRRDRERWLLDYAGRLAASTPEQTPVREGTPLAALTEGLVPYARMLKDAGESDATRDILDRIARNLRTQLRFFHPSGAFIHSVAKPEVRIDYIRHHAAGFLGYARLAREEAAVTPTASRARSRIRRVS